jgi:hypothetical protein
VATSVREESIDWASLTGIGTIFPLVQISPPLVYRIWRPDARNGN